MVSSCSCSEEHQLRGNPQPKRALARIQGLPVPLSAPFTDGSFPEVSTAPSIQDPCPATDSQVVPSRAERRRSSKADDHWYLPLPTNGRISVCACYLLAYCIMRRGRVPWFKAQAQAQGFEEHETIGVTLFHGYGGGRG